MADTDVTTGEGGERMVKGLVLGQTLGKGTFGYVKLGTKKETGHQFALKFLKRDVRNFNEKAVRQEIECMKKIRHKNVVALLASTMKCKYPLADGGTENTVLMVMEFANGGDLYDVIYYAGAMDEKMGRTYFKQLLDGCAAIHAAGITHRDLKPNNILIDHKYNLKITDFGLSHIAAEGVDPTQKRMKTSWVGTRGYRAPELVLKARYSNQADVFALGVCLFVMLCARQPFKVASASDPWYKCIATRQFDKYWRSHKSSALSDDAKKFLEGLMCYQPRERTTIEGAYKEPWMTADMYSEEQLPEVMQKAHKTANEKKMKDPERAKRLQASAPGEKRGDGNPYLKHKIPEIETTEHGWTSWVLKDSINCGEAFAFVQDCCAKFMKSEFEEQGDFQLKGTYAAIIEGKGEASIEFTIRIVSLKGQNLFVFCPARTEFWELVDTAITIVLDSLLRNEYIDGYYNRVFALPEVAPHDDFDFGDLEKEDDIQEEEVQPADA